MGFTCGFYRVNRHGGNYTPKQINYIEKYLSYDENEWAKKQFSSAEDYAKSTNLEDYYNEVDEFPNEHVVNLFREDYIQREYSKSIYETLGDWCSGGAYFHGWIIPSNKWNVDEVELSKDKVIELTKRCMKELDDMKLEEVVIRRSYKIENDDPDDWEGTKDVYISSPCDGVEVEFCGGALKRIATNDAESTGLYTSENYFDPDVRCTLMSLLDVLVNILADTDWDEQQIIYSGGW